MGSLTSVVSGSAFLHAGGFRFGDVLVVGLVLQLPAEVLDGFVQAFLQGHLSTRDNTYNIRIHKENMTLRIVSDIGSKYTRQSLSHDEILMEAAN